MEGERDEAVDSVARRTGLNWREAVKALAGEPLPGRLREALVEVGAQGHRLRLAVDAYNARLDALWSDPAEREQPARSLLDWPEHAEREEARRAWESAKQIVAAYARAWVEGTPAGGGCPTAHCVRRVGHAEIGQWHEAADGRVWKEGET